MIPLPAAALVKLARTAPNDAADLLTAFRAASTSPDAQMWLIACAAVLSQPISHREHAAALLEQIFGPDPVTAQEAQ